MNLSDKRRELLELCKTKDFKIESIFQEIKNQDKEFIKRLKENSTFERGNVGINKKIIYVNDLDKLAGDDLIK